MNPEISVIIPCYNRAKILKKTLSAYDRQVPIDGGFEIIAVDDGSTDGTFELLKEYRPAGYSLRFLKQENSGPGMARNQGIQMAKGKYILFTGDDIIPTRNFISAHLSMHRELDMPEVAVLGKTIWDEETPITSAMRHITGKGAQQFNYYYMKPNTYVDFRHFYTSNISINAEFLRNLDHFFDNDFTKAAFEDIELGYRLDKKGMKIYYTDSPLAMHDHFYSIQAFCNRQYNAGLMSYILIQKHPELKKLFSSDLIIYRHLISLRSISKNRALFSSKELTLEVFEDAFKGLAMRYGVSNDPPLDELYRSLFLYFFLKGQAVSSLDNAKARSICEGLALLFLSTTISKFIKNLHDIKTPLISSELRFFEENLNKSIPMRFYERALIFGYKFLKDRIIRYKK